jgi:hypothetical protein
VLELICGRSSIHGFVVAVARSNVSVGHRVFGTRGLTQERCEASPASQAVALDEPGQPPVPASEVEQGSRISGEERAEQFLTGDTGGEMAHSVQVSVDLAWVAPSAGRGLVLGPTGSHRSIVSPPVDRWGRASEARAMAAGPQERQINWAHPPYGVTVDSIDEP